VELLEHNEGASAARAAGAASVQRAPDVATGRGWADVAVRHVRRHVFRRQRRLGGAALPRLCLVCVLSCVPSRTMGCVVVSFLPAVAPSLCGPHDEYKDNCTSYITTSYIYLPTTYTYLLLLPQLPPYS